MKKKLIVVLGLSVILLNTAIACSRFTYDAGNEGIITGRSMDWVEDIHTNLWAFPAGMKRVGGDTANSVNWTSKYGSIVAVGYGISAADGINTKGLDVNLLYLSDANYGAVDPSKKDLSVLSWVQYVLDNYATVPEVVKGLEDEKFNMIAPKLPNGDASAVHLSVTDSSGDNAIFEYVDGKLVVHEGKQYAVMTNEPTYDKQLALNDYWQNLKGRFLPGTGSPEDRFVRASYYLSVAPKKPNNLEAIATAFSIIRNVSVPMTTTISDRPNVAATLWRTVADLTHQIYYFESVDRPNVFWVDLNKLHLQSGDPVEELKLSDGEVYSGEVSQHFVKTTAFQMH